MKALGLNGDPQNEGGDNICYRVEHWNPKPAENGRQIPAINQWYNVDGTDYQVHLYILGLHVHLECYSQC